MLLLILLCLIFISPIIICKFTSIRFWDDVWPGVISIIMGIVFFAFLIVTIIVNCELKTFSITKYKITSEYLNYVSTNNQISESERLDLLNCIKDINSCIQNNKVWNGNVWIGCWYSKTVAELPLLDFNKIPKANPTSTNNINISSGSGLEKVIGGK